jgi:hypothetical protein
MGYCNYIIDFGGQDTIASSNTQTNGEYAENAKTPAPNEDVAREV